MTSQVPTAPDRTGHEEASVLLAAARQDIDDLRAELEETNRGVVALYAELDAQAAQLQLATELKSRFLSYMSHEFRTPVSAIRSIARLLSDGVDGPLNGEQHTQVRFISTAAGELTEMVDDLLDLAKIEAGRVTISPGWFEMVDLFAALRGMFRPIVEGEDVDLVFEEPVGMPALYTDNKKVAQILRNFISNALKFTPSGTVRIEAASEDADWVRFTVTDTGIGIPPELHDKLFEDFSQLDSPLQRRVRGSGLGLALSKRFAGLLGGHVGMRSEVGMGSAFHVVLPVALADPEAGDVA